MLGASECDIAVDTACSERFEIGFAAVARVAEACSGLRPRLFSIASTKGTNLALIAAALREFVRDNDLGLCVDGCLCVIGLDEHFHFDFANAAVGSVKLRCAGIRFVR